MELPDINQQLMKEDLFLLFKIQLKKDFESSGLSGDFVDSLPLGFEWIKDAILKTLQPVFTSHSSLIPILLYRIDISELQIKNYSKSASSLPYEEVLAELIIKRILQKVILKKRFSG